MNKYNYLIDKYLEMLSKFEKSLYVIDSGIFTKEKCVVFTTSNNLDTFF